MEKNNAKKIYIIIKKNKIDNNLKTKLNAKKSYQKIIEE